VSWEALEQVVAAKVLLNAIDTSERLRALGIPHALVGGLAVGLHGHPRATQDVDFLVGQSAFAKVSPVLVLRDELREVMRVGVVDFIAAIGTDAAFASSLQVPDPGEVPLIRVEILVVMKLRAGRLQDIADIEHLLEAGADVASILDYLRELAPELLARFSTIADTARGPPEPLGEIGRSDPG